jgi:hypothetical protein
MDMTEPPLVILNDNQDRKLRALSVATAHSFPTADIEEMLAEIERGYLEESL